MYETEFTGARRTNKLCLALRRHRAERVCELQELKQLSRAVEIYY